MGNAACLKDIQYFLRHDAADTCEVQRQLGEWSLVANHLVPLLEGCVEIDDASMFYEASASLGRCGRAGAQSPLTRERQ